MIKEIHKENNNPSNNIYLPIIVCTGCGSVHASFWCVQHNKTVRVSCPKFHCKSKNNPVKAYSSVFETKNLYIDKIKCNNVRATKKYAVLHSSMVNIIREILRLDHTILHKLLSDCENVGIKNMEDFQDVVCKKLDEFKKQKIEPVIDGSHGVVVVAPPRKRQNNTSAGMTETVPKKKRNYTPRSKGTAATKGEKQPTIIQQKITAMPAVVQQPTADQNANISEDETRSADFSDEDIDE